MFFTDNFYTRHIHANELNKTIDNEARLCGTIKFTNVDASNRPGLVVAIAKLEDAPRGKWLLVRAYDKISNYETLRRQYVARQKKLPQNEMSVFILPTKLVAKNAEFVV